MLCIFQIINCSKEKKIVTVFGRKPQERQNRKLFKYANFFRLYLVRQTLTFLQVSWKNHFQNSPKDIQLNFYK